MGFIQDYIGVIGFFVISLIGWILVKATGINAGKTITDGNSQSFVVYYPKKLTWIALLMFLWGQISSDLWMLLLSRTRRRSCI